MSLSKEQKELLDKHYRSGELTHRAIAKLANLKYSSVYSFYRRSKNSKKHRVKKEHPWTRRENIRLSQAQKKELHKLYSLGTYTHWQIAEKVGTTYAQVYAFYFQHKGIHYYTRPARNPRTPRNYETPVLITKLEEAYQCYLNGLTLAQVGMQYGKVSRQRVEQVFKKYKSSSVL